MSLFLEDKCILFRSERTRFSRYPPWHRVFGVAQLLQPWECCHIVLSISVSGRHEWNCGTTEHISHRSDDTSTRVVISVSKTHTKETFWSASHPSTQTPSLLGLKHMCWLCPFKVLLEMLQCVSVYVCMEMTYFLWCVFLRNMQHCNCQCPKEKKFDTLQ